MVLYAADISKLAEPVSKSVQPKQRKKIVKEKEPDAPPVPETVVPEKIKKPRKPRQKKEKVPEAEPVPVEEKPVPQLVVEEPKIETKKPAPKKRKQPIEEVDAESATMPTPTPSPKKKKIEEKKQRKPRDPTVPPLWFEKYIQGVKKEEAAAKQEKVSAKQVKQEAQEAAQKSWENGLTRDRVANEVDQHLSRMYNMVFSRR